MIWKPTKLIHTPHTQGKDRNRTHTKRCETNMLTTKSLCPELVYPKNVSISGYVLSKHTPFYITVIAMIKIFFILLSLCCMLLRIGY